jgi:hypothetical protein
MTQRNVPDGFIIQIGIGDAGEFIAVSDVSPYFCLFGKTEEEVLDKATKAVLAYENLGVRSVPQLANTQSDVAYTRFRGKPITLQGVAA